MASRKPAAKKAAGERRETGKTSRAEAEAVSYPPFGQGEYGPTGQGWFAKPAPSRQPKPKKNPPLKK